MTIKPFQHYKVDPIPYKPGSLNQRYLRLKITPKGSQEGGMPLADIMERPEFNIPNAYSITMQSCADRSWKSAKKCIYCGATEYQRGTSEPLHEEHILAEGLGGNIILPEASCHDCEVAVLRSEGKVLRTSFLAPRAQMRVRRKKRPREDSYPLTTEVDGKDVEVLLTLEQHQSVLLMVALNAPRILVPRAALESDVQGVFAHGFQTRPLMAPIATPGFDMLRFSQMLAKIAHGYAVWKFGLDGFQHFLPKHILNEHEKKAEYDRTIFSYIGGIHGTHRPTDDLHTLGHDIVYMGDIRFLVVYIRLFANLGAPIYQVVAGIIPDSGTNKLAINKQFTHASPVKFPLRLG